MFLVFVDQPFTFLNEEMCIQILFLKGNEGFGLRRDVKGLCDILTTIPSDTNCTVESLNVSVATGIYHFISKSINRC